MSQTDQCDHYEPFHTRPPNHYQPGVTGSFILSLPSPGDLTVIRASLDPPQTLLDHSGTGAIGLELERALVGQGRIVVAPDLVVARRKMGPGIEVLRDLPLRPG